MLEEQQLPSSATGLCSLDVFEISIYVADSGC